MQHERADECWGSRFDDQFIYQQIPLDSAARALPMAQVGREAAMQRFEDRTMKEGNARY